MKLSNTEIELHSAGVQNVTQFRVATNAKVLRMLSDGLYSDKIKAPIQELSANAFDSHIAAGRENRPFVVNLPCDKDSTFSIRDFGVGLTQEELEGLYTTYGDSTKNSSNDVIGCLGIGSKSPFCYTDSFTVTSFRDGMKYVYIAGRDEKDIPTLSRMLIEETDEDNGLLVSFSVKRNDFFTFYNKAVEVYKHYPIRPIFTGYKTEYPPSDTKIVLSGEAWRMVDDKRFNSYAVMGYTEYEIDTQFFDQKESHILSLELELDFEIGEIEMAINREALQYTKKTISVIRERINFVYNEIKSTLEGKIKACKTAWEARCVYSSLVKKSYDQKKTLYPIANYLDLAWNSIDITRDISLHENSTNSLRLTYIHNGYVSKERKHTHYISPRKTTKFYVNDLKSGGKALAQKASREEGCDVIYLINRPKDDCDGIKLSNAIDYVVEKTGINKEDLVYVSSLPKEQREVIPHQKTKQFKFDVERHSRIHNNYTSLWQDAEVDLDGEGFYVTLSGNNTVFKSNGQSIVTSELCRSLKHAVGLGITIPPFYGIRPSHAKKIKENPKWVNLFDYFKKELSHIISINPSLTRLDEFTDFDSVSENMLDHLSRLKDSIKNNKFAKIFLENYFRVKEDRKTVNGKVYELLSLSDAVSYELPKSNNTFKFGENLKEVYSRYPVLSILPSDMADWTNIKKVIDYVNLIDSTTP